ncbi:MAG: hypothetical protein H6822_06565 [Planctomycetaceae bacterium]|nr:hypothetical protein [Planctomycetales bacterium]MCB9921824.1 hypothetical protein [Planctomycetaceae bacterium]
MPRRSRSKRLERAIDRFKEELTAFIESKGATAGRFYEHKIETPAGLLHISINEGWIATRFEDVGAGNAFTKSCGVPCNPYSGKWNFHYPIDSVTSIDPRHVIADFGYYLGRLLEWESIESVFG